MNRNLTDQFYRYKMPKLMAKVEGKGNGIKTVIVNMVEIAKALNRPPMCKSTVCPYVLFATFSNRINLQIRPSTLAASSEPR